MRILLTTPFFKNLGGSELETIHTANELASFEYVETVDLFVYENFDLEFARGIFIDPKVKFLRKNQLLKSRFFLFVDRLWIKKLKRFEKLTDVIYWNAVNVNRYDRVYIITKTTLNYFLPFLKRYKILENVLIKYTTFFYQNIPKENFHLVSKVKCNLVTSNSQSDYFKHVLGIHNTEPQEIIVYNEGYGLLKKRKHKEFKQFDFGILGRFYPEKNLEDAISLIASLKEMGFYCKLLIKGGGLPGYFNLLSKQVEELDIIDLVTLEFETVPYTDTFDFFDSIDCFLITSKYEGGPNIGLEAMAYGLPIISYDVGAMKDRLSNFPELIAENYENLVEIAVSYLRNKDSLFNYYCENIKKEYLLKYSNKNKIDFLSTFLNHTSR